MLKTMAAVIVAAVCAGMIVGLIPPPGAALAAITPQASVDGNRAITAEARLADIRRPACRLHWPYYERVCLSDIRQPNGKARAVRLITAATWPARHSAHVRH
jgi:hypothetical protein